MCQHLDKCVVFGCGQKATSFSCSLLRDPSEYQMNYYAVSGDVNRSPLVKAMMRLETNLNLKNCRLMLTLKKKKLYFEFLHGISIRTFSYKWEEVLCHKPFDFVSEALMCKCQHVSLVDKLCRDPSAHPKFPFYRLKRKLKKNILMSFLF